MIKKIIIPAGGLGTRFLPLSKILAKEFFPLIDRPMIEFGVKEAKEAGIEEIIFVLSENKKFLFEYFKKNQKLEKILKENNYRKEALELLQKKEKEFEGFTFSFCSQPYPRGDGEAILRAKKFIKKNEGFGVLFPDDVFESKEPPLGQLIRIFRTSQKLVIGLKRVSPEKISSYGIVRIEKIAHKLYKIKEIQEKPILQKTPSDLAVVGRYILTPEIFNYLRKTSPNKKGEIILAQALNQAIEDGKVVYGYEIAGRWLECGKKIDWLKSNFYLCLNHPEYGPELREWIKKMK